MTAHIEILPALPNDVPALESLIREAVMVLQAADYSEDQRKGALGTVFGVDSRLIEDGTYFKAMAGKTLVGCGGWSRRQTLFGSDAIAGKNDRRLDPEVDAARIRAFFVKPEWARRGVGRQILKACEAAALSAGFKHFELVATVTGVALYKATGYQIGERYETPLPNGLSLPVVRMAKVATPPTL
jgi:GNAT superfamily N-acetyltransferase